MIALLAFLLLCMAVFGPALGLRIWAVVVTLMFGVLVIERRRS